MGRPKPWLRVTFRRWGVVEVESEAGRRKREERHMDQSNMGTELSRQGRPSHMHKGDFDSYEKPGQRGLLSIFRRKEENRAQSR